MTSAGHPSPSISNPTSQTVSGDAAHVLSPEHQALVAQAFESLYATLGYLAEADRLRVREAFEFAHRAHSGQYRNSGEPYITHPIAVTQLCADWKLDAPALMAALMHDSLEDCGVSKGEMAQMFGTEVAGLVDGVTKLDKVESQTKEELQAGSFRKMLLAMSKDVRVMLIKLADRTHNMRTLSLAPRRKWGRISQETQEIYAPIAARLGLHTTYRELLDLSFQHLHPWRYQILLKAVDKVKDRRQSAIKAIRDELEQAFAKQQIKVRLIEQVPTLSKLYKQMSSKRQSFSKINDVVEFWAVLENPLDCYTGLGVLHAVYRPFPNSIKDFIANPKSNGYQSLHTAVMGPSNVTVEINLCTEAMRELAEIGVIAARWGKEKGLGPANADGWDKSWMKSMLEIEHVSGGAVTDFLSDVKKDLHPTTVYVFTPQKRVLAFPAGATVVDFAYAIHSELGNSLVGANVNGNPVTLHTELNNSDEIEVFTSPMATPAIEWLAFVKTGKARSEIRAYIRKADEGKLLALGQKILDRALHVIGYPGVEESEKAEAVRQCLGEIYPGKTHKEVLLDIGHGRMVAADVAKRLDKPLRALGMRPDALLLSRESLMQNVSSVVLTVGDKDSAAAYYSPCCYPIPGDAILGVFVAGKGVEVHRRECLVGQRAFQRATSSAMEIEWAEKPFGTFEVMLHLHLENTPGALAEAAKAIASCGANILLIEMLDGGRLKTTEVRAKVSVEGQKQLDRLLRELRRGQTVLRVERYLAKDSKEAQKL